MSDVAQVVVGYALMMVAAVVACLCLVAALFTYGLALLGLVPAWFCFKFGANLAVGP